MTAPDALSADIAEAKADVDDAPTYEPVTFRGVTYGIQRKPSTLLLSELARTQSGDPEALGVFAEFFESTLGGSYRAFKKAVFLSDVDVEMDELYDVLGQIVEHTLNRPTQ